VLLQRLKWYRKQESFPSAEHLTALGMEKSLASTTCESYEFPSRALITFTKEIACVKGSATNLNITITSLAGQGKGYG